MSTIKKQTHLAYIIALVVNEDEELERKTYRLKPRKHKDRYIEDIKALDPGVKPVCIESLRVAGVLIETDLQQLLSVSKITVINNQ